MNKDEIEVGNIVSITLVNGDWYEKLEVLYVPWHTGDSWRLKNIDTGQLLYVQLFGMMTLMGKRENVKKDNAKE